MFDAMEPEFEPAAGPLAALTAALSTGHLATGLALLTEALHQQAQSQATTLLLAPELASQLAILPVRPHHETVGDSAIGVAICALVAPDTAYHAPLLFPLVRNDELFGWLRLQVDTTTDPLHLPTPQQLTLGQEFSAAVTALLIWARQQTDREYHALRSVRTLVQHIHQTRLLAVNDLAAGLAHEINNPISAIVGIAALMQRDPTLSEMSSEDLGSITTEALRISTLVSRLAHFGQAIVSSKSPVEINTVIVDTLAVMQGLFDQHRILYRADLPAESPLVLGNQAQLQQLCLDLLNNAVDAVETTEAPEIVVRVDQLDAEVLVTISDNGCGIPEEYRERVFEMGFTTKSNHGTRHGLGVGLPMAQEIVRTHWGSILLESVVWGGTKCYVRLPAI